MNELKEGWNGPFDATIIGSKPQGIEGSPQWKGAYPPFKDVPQWNCRVGFPGGSAFMIFHSQDQPTNGEVMTNAWIEHKEKKAAPGKFITVLYSEQQKSDKKAAGGGFGGGAKPNLSREEELFLEATKLAVNAFAAGVLDKDGNPLKFTMDNLERVRTKFLSDIINAGKQQ